MAGTMKATVLRDWNRFEMEDVPRPVITAPDDVIAKVLVSSICGTDVSLSSQPGSPYGDMRGRILGHEAVAEVCEVGERVRGCRPGDRIVFNPNSYCGICPACRRGMRNHCENMELLGITVPGSFAEYVKTKDNLVFPISRDVPLSHAVFAEPLSCVMNGFSRLSMTPGDTCVVFGCGPIGLLFAQLARKSGARVACIEPKEQRIRIAKRLGFTVYRPGMEHMQDTLIKQWGRRADFCIDAAGGQLAVAIDLAEYRGTVLSFAGTRSTGTADLSPIQGKELTIKGSFIISDSMARAVTVLENDLLDLDPIITHELPLSEVGRGIELMKSGEGMKIILNIAKEADR